MLCKFSVTRTDASLKTLSGVSNTKSSITGWLINNASEIERNRNRQCPYEVIFRRFSVETEENHEKFYLV